MPSSAGLTGGGLVWQSRKSAPCICQEIVEVLAAVKVVNVGQALPSHKHQGQHGIDGRWLRGERGPG